MAGDAGSMAGGVALIVIGGLFLMYTALDFSMEWVQEWWPIGPMIFGVYLVYKSRTSKKDSAGTARAD